ncbi:MAG: hypothetical protein IJ702_04530 [Fretibacterium sp.]|nr:hypothetical protein [Fretibacterium sp.]
MAVGLGQFDVSDIDKSVVDLLGGMKLAFWTSILGMLCAFIIHIVQYLFGFLPTKRTAEGVGAQDIFNVIQAGADETKKSNAILQRLADSIGESKDSSLLTGITALRMETSDMKTTLLDAFNSFAEKMAKNNSDALTESLNNLIKEFNVKITEQFGDNFKQLNQAVGALLVWQKNNMATMNALVQQFKTAQEGIAASQQEIAKIRENLSVIPGVMAQMQNTINALDTAIRDSTEVIGGFVALRVQAAEVFPDIEAGINGLTDSLQSSVTRSTSAIERSVKTQEETVTQLKGTLTESTQLFNNILEREINDLTSSLKSSVGQSTSEIKSAVENMQRSTEEQHKTLQSLGSILRQSMDAIQTDFKNASDEIDQTMKKSFNNLDEQMEGELRRVISLMGSNLASVSEKLVNDYQNLTGKISALADQANRQRSQR